MLPVFKLEINKITCYGSINQIGIIDTIKLGGRRHRKSILESARKRNIKYNW